MPLEALGGLQVALCREQEVDGSAMLVDGPVQVTPLSAWRLCVASRVHPRTVCPGRIDRPAILIEGATAKVSSVIHHRSPGAEMRQGISFLASGLYGETVAHLLQPMPKLRA